jgi:hypothetical protein
VAVGGFAEIKTSDLNVGASGVQVSTLRFTVE